jgi:hypothetical protein
MLPKQLGDYRIEELLPSIHNTQRFSITHSSAPHYLYTAELLRLPPSVASFIQLAERIVTNLGSDLIKEVLLLKGRKKKYLVLIKDPQRKGGDPKHTLVEMMDALTSRRLMISALLFIEELHSLGLRLTFPL